MKKYDLLEQIREYANDVFSNKNKFIAGVSYVPASGAIISPEDIVSVCNTVLDGWFTEGKASKNFSELLSDYLGIPHIALCNSGSSANLIALLAVKDQYKINHRKKVITCATGFPTTIAPIIQAGFVPLFIDAEPKTLNPNIQTIRSLLERDDVAGIIQAHTLGFPFDAVSVCEFCVKNEKFFIEDSCDSLGSTVDDELVGRFGDIATFSYFPAHTLSCHPLTQIPYLDDKGTFCLNSIEYIYSAYHNSPSSIKILSYNNKHLAWSSPSYIVKHATGNKRLFELILQHGKSVIVTEDHSVFVLDNNSPQIIQKRVDELSEHDYIVCMTGCELPPKIASLNLIQEFAQLSAYKFFVSGFPIKCLNDIKNRDAAWQYKHRNSLPAEFLAKEYDESSIFIGVKQSNKIPSCINVDNELCRLIGYYLAEGSYSSHGLEFSFHKDETDLIEDVLSICKHKFGVSGYIVKAKGKGIVIKIDNLNMKLLFHDVLHISSGAHNKRIPYIIFHAGIENIKSFIYGYTKGDGSYSNDSGSYHIDVTSVSKDLLNDYMYLLSMIGISGSFYRRNKGEKTKIIMGRSVNSSDNFTVRFNGFIYDEELKTISFKNYSHKSDYVTQIPSTYWIKNNIMFGEAINKDYKTLSKKRVNFIANKKGISLGCLESNDIGYYKIRQIREITDKPEFVYDFSVPNTENFIGGISGILLHNTMGEGGALATSSEQIHKLICSYRNWGRDCQCLPGQNNVCGRRFEHKWKNLPSGYDHKYTFTKVGYNLQITDMQAALGVSQFQNLQEFIDMRRYNYQYLLDGLIEFSEHLQFVEPLPNSEPVPFGFPISIISTATTKKDFVSYLEQNKIHTRPLFAGNIVRQPMMENVQYRIAEDLSGSDWIMEHTFWIGCHPELTSAHLDYVLDTIYKYFKKEI